jgi:hypothetical protein
VMNPYQGLNDQRLMEGGCRVHIAAPTKENP